MGGIEVAGLVGGGTVLTVLVTVVGYLLVSNRADRRQYEEAIDKAQKRADAAEQRAQAAWQVVEAERSGRHACEEALAQLRRSGSP